MKKVSLRITLYLFLLLVSAFLSFYFEGYYKKMMRYFYEAFTFNRVSFYFPSKYMDFPSSDFIITLWLFLVLYYHFLIIKKSRPAFLRNLFPFSISFVSLLLMCYIDVNVKLMECTQCVDGRIQLFYNAVPYDALFILSLIFGGIPLMLVLFSNYFKRNKTNPIRLQSIERPGKGNN